MSLTTGEAGLVATAGATAAALLTLLMGRWIRRDAATVGAAKRALPLPRTRTAAQPRYQLTFGVSRDWVELPVTENWGVYTEDKTLEAWAQGQARAMLGTAAATSQVADRAGQLASFTYYSRALGAHFGLALYPEGTPGPVARLDVKRIFASRQGRRVSADAVRSMFANPATEIDEAQIHLASGPAFRVRRRTTHRDDETGGSAVTEELIYAIWPPSAGDTVIMVFVYSARASHTLARIAEAMASSMRLEPAGPASEPGADGPAPPAGTLA